MNARTAGGNAWPRPDNEAIACSVVESTWGAAAAGPSDRGNSMAHSHLRCTSADVCVLTCAAGSGMRITWSATRSASCSNASW